MHGKEHIRLRQRRQRGAERVHRFRRRTSRANGLKMKTHELARILRRLAKLLDDQPDEDIDSFELGRSRRPPPDSANIPFALSTLVSLSEFDKGQWEQLINEFHFPISV